MTGLPYIAENIKSLLKWGLVTVVALFGLWLLWLTFSFTYRVLFPPPPPPPDIAFGKIRQPIVFNSNFSANVFVLNTPGNVVVTPPRVLTVYEVPPISGEFSSLENAKKIAKSAGLDSDPQQISDNEWRFTNSKNPNRSLKYNIVTNNFVYKYDWNSDTKALEGVFKTNEKTIVNKAQSFLSSFKALKDDLKTGTTRITYWKIIGNDRNQVGSFSEANAVMVEFFRKEIDEKNKFVEVDPNRSQVNAWISPSNSTERQLLELNSTYYAYNLEKKGTYPPKSGNTAFEDLRSGKAFIAVGSDKNFESITINKTSFAYINPSTEQSYLQQVYVFEGKGKVGGEMTDFLAFVPAIDSQYLR